MTEFNDAIQDETIEAPDTDAPPPPDRETYTELIECTLSEEERDEKRKRLEAVDRELIRLDVEKKAAAKVFTNQIKPLEAERDSILQALDAGTEKRQVEVYEHFDDRLGKVEVRRVDTDAVVEERAMTAQEREDSAQGDLFASQGSAPPLDITDPADPESADGANDFEPTAEALGQAAVDENRVVKISAKEARAKKKQREAAAEGGESNGV